MTNQATFGNADLAKKMAAKFGTNQETVKVEMRYAEEVEAFIRKICEAHKRAANSKLAFR